VSWASPTGPGPKLIEEIKRAEPVVEKMSRNGLRFSGPSLQRFLQEQKAELARRSRAVSRGKYRALRDVETSTELKDVLTDSFRIPGLPRSPLLKSWLRHAVAKKRLDRGLCRALKSLWAVRSSGSSIALARGLVDAMADDGRVRSVWYDSSARTNRTISIGDRSLKAVCLQNLPGHLLAGTTAAPQGRVFLNLDFACLDLFSLAIMSGDTKLLAAVKADVYLAVARLLSPPDRETAKLATLMWLYGAAPASVAAFLDVNRVQAGRLIAQLDAEFSTAAGFLTSCADHMKKTVRSLPSWTGWIRPGGRPDTVGKNAPVQGTSSDIFRAFFTLLDSESQKAGLVCEPVVFVHDGGSWEIEAGTEPGVRQLLARVLDLLVAHLHLPQKPWLKIGFDPAVKKPEEAIGQVQESGSPAMSPPPGQPDHRGLDDLIENLELGGEYGLDPLIDGPARGLDS